MVQQEQLRNIDYRQPFLNLLPALNVSYTRRKQSSFSFGYNSAVRQPDARQIQPLIDNTNPLFLQQGNPDLKQAFDHSFSLALNDGKVLKQRWLYARFNYRTTMNAFGIRSQIDSFGRNITQTINTAGNNNFWGNINYSRQIAKSAVSFNSSVNSGFGKTVNYLNNAPSVTRSGSASFALGLDVDLDAVYFEFNFNHNQNYSRNSLNDIVNNNWTRSIEGSLNINLPLEISINMELTSNFRQKTAIYAGNRNNTIITGEINKPIFKNRFLITLGVYDLLNQNFQFINGYISNLSPLPSAGREFTTRISYTFKK